jgi:peptide/nickel transport system ATP-binding protein
MKPEKRREHPLTGATPMSREAPRHGHGRLGHGHDKGGRRYARWAHQHHLPGEMLLEVEDLKVFFPVLRGLLLRKVADVKAVDGVSFSLKRGEVLGLVGESGCGKTTVGRAIIRLYRPTAGRIVFEGRDISHIKERQMRPLRKKMAYIFQDPYGSLNPRQSAASIIGEPMLVQKMAKSRAERKARVDELFNIVGLDPSMGGRFPHEFSGGQRQRIGIARALACDPSLIICDEPISALDVSIQAQVINLLKELQAKFQDLTYIFIAHDLAVVKHVSDRIAVMYLGHIVEMAEARELCEAPLHPYTKALLSAVPVPDPVVEETRERIILTGEVPSPLNPPPGCPFHQRCSLAIPDCSLALPELREVAPVHQVACIRVGEVHV